MLEQTNANVVFLGRVLGEMYASNVVLLFVTLSQTQANLNPFFPSPSLYSSGGVRDMNGSEINGSSPHSSLSSAVPPSFPVSVSPSHSCSFSLVTKSIRITALGLFFHIPQREKTYN